MKNFSICISAALCLLAASSAVMASSGAMTAAAGDTATIKIKSKNLDGRKLTYNRSYNGVYLPTFTPAELDADSTVTITIPADGVERMMVFANDTERKLAGVSKSLYILPGITDITIDPLAEEKVAVVTPTCNSLDATAAQSAESIYNLWFALVTGRRDALGLSSDTVPTVVTSKLTAYGDSILGVYSDASPAIMKALERDVHLEALMVYKACCFKATDRPDASKWEQELARLRKETGLTNPANALNPFFAQELAGAFYYSDTFPDGNIPSDITPDSLLKLKTEYFLNAMPGKAAEAAIGTMLYNDGARSTFSRGAPALTERFKALFPDSGIIPLLEEKARENYAFNHPAESEEIVFLDNAGIKSIADMLAPYKGKPVLIDLWATWCGSCRKSFGHVEPIQQYAAEKRIKLLYLSIDEQPGIEDQWKRMARFYKLRGDHLLINADIKHEIYSTFGENDILTIPRFVIVDRDGNITLCPQPLSENPDFAPLRTLLNQHLDP